MDDAGSAIPRRLPRKSAALAAVLGWILPGLGQIYVGRPGKGLYFLIVVLATYAAGLVLGDFRCVNYDREPIWFLAQALAAGPTAAVAWLTSGYEVVHLNWNYDAGLLYCAVAALLNAVVVADALGTVDEIDREASDREDEMWALRAEASAKRAVEEKQEAEAARAAAASEEAPALPDDAASSLEAPPAAEPPPAEESDTGDEPETSSDAWTDAPEPPS